MHRQANLRRVMAGLCVVVALSGCAAGTGVPGASGSSGPSSVSPTVAVPTSVPATPSVGPPTVAPTPPPPTGLLLFARRPSTVPFGPPMNSVVAVDGSGLRAIGAGDAGSWSVDGRLVHIVSEDAACVPSLISVAADGSGRTVVASGLKVLDGGFAWSPDDRQIAFIRYRATPPMMCGSQGGVWPADETVADLMVMNADGTGQEALVRNVWPMRPITWSPDGTRIAFLDVSLPEQNREIVKVVQVRDGAVAQLAGSPADSLVATQPPLAWSPDGTRLALVHWRTANGPPGVAVISVAGGGIQDLGPAASPGTPFAGAAWSPDGSTVATVRGIVGADGSIAPGADILLLSAFGGGARALGLTDAEGYGPGGPTWSPDGAWLAYVAAKTDTAGTHPGAILLTSIDGRVHREVSGTGPTTGFQGSDWVAWQPTRLRPPDRRGCPVEYRAQSALGGADPMFPTLGTIGPLVIGTHDAFSVTAILVGLGIYYVELRRRGWLDATIFWISMAALLGGAIGARLITVWERPEVIAAFATMPFTMAIELSGKSIIGAVAGAYLAIVLAKRTFGYRRSTGDCYALALPVATAIGRVGCFLTELPLGTPTSLPWGMTVSPSAAAAFPVCPGCTGAMHPTMLYEIAFNLVAAVLIWRFRRLVPVPGDTLKLYLIAAGIFRFLVEFLRTSPPQALGLTAPQWVLIPLLVALGIHFVRQAARGAWRVPLPPPPVMEVAS